MQIVKSQFTQKKCQTLFSDRNKNLLRGALFIYLFRELWPQPHWDGVEYAEESCPEEIPQLAQYCCEFLDFKQTSAVCTRFIEHSNKVSQLMVHIGDKATGYLPKKIFGESSEGKDVFAKILVLEE